MYVFVYGTLKKGFYNHGFLTRRGEMVRFIENATIRGKMYDLGSYPAIILDDIESGQIQGEVYEITSKILDQLDDLEGVPTLYSKSEIQVNEKILAWVYHMKPNQVIKYPEIRDGIWNKK
jgi:gamma-glutamylcyclotransferase (GGCT)/AIG2-like uncharacterized protein YtfP